LAQAAQLDSDARGAIPHDVQQLVVIDYRPAELEFGNGAAQRVMPPELKAFDEALKKTALKGAGTMDQYVDQLAFALFRPSATGDSMDTVGIAQGISGAGYCGCFQAQKLKPVMVRTNSIYPMTKAGWCLAL